MGECHHTNLELIPVRKRTLRCCHCHLTLDSEELGDNCCPECFDSSGQRRYEFDEVESAGAAVVTYRCEQCGAIVKMS